MLVLNKSRESGIELLKIITIFLIIICHVYSSFATAINPSTGTSFFDSYSFSVLEYFIFQIIITFGYIGNTIFFVCSAWYLTDDKQNKTEKVIGILINCFLISILFYFVHLLLGIDVNEFTISSFFPIINENNWYISAYVLFYLIHPYLNIVLNKLDKKEHFIIAFVLFALYFIICFFTKENYFYKTDVLIFIVIYIIVSYIKKYMADYCNNMRINIILLIFSLILFYSIIFINFAITPIDLKWHVLNNPFFLIIALCLFNIFRKLHFSNNVINTISGLTLFIYIMHDNIIFRSITRPILAAQCIQEFGINNTLLEMIIFSLVLLTICIILSYLYILCSRKIVNGLSVKIKNILYKTITNLI